MMKKILAVMMALLMAGALAACGGSSESSSAAASSEAASSEAASSEEASSEEASSEAASGEKLNAIKEAGEIVMLTNATFPPFEYIGSGGEYAGVDVDVAQEIANDLGVELKVVDMNFDLLIDAVKNDKGDFVAAGMTITPEREEQVNFSIEYVQSAQYVLVPQGSTVTTDALDGLTIAVQESTTGDFYATDDVAAKEVLRFKSATEVGAALAAGKCDCAILDRLPAETIASNSEGALVVLPESLTEESYAFAVKKGNDDLLEAINATLQRLIDEGKVDELVNKHMIEAA